MFYLSTGLTPQPNPGVQPLILLLLWDPATPVLWVRRASLCKDCHFCSVTQNTRPASRRAGQWLTQSVVTHGFSQPFWKLELDTSSCLALHLWSPGAQALLHSNREGTWYIWRSRHKATINMCWVHPRAEAHCPGKLKHIEFRTCCGTGCLEEDGKGTPCYQHVPMTFLRDGSWCISVLFNGMSHHHDHCHLNL